MTQNQPDRLDRIEATLERVSQQLDNQVVVNAELRQSVVQLTSSVNSLIGVANQHQENFMILVTEIREIRTDMREMQSEIRGLQTENRRILGILEGLENQD